MMTDPVSAQFCTQLWLLCQSALCTHLQSNSQTVQTMLGSWESQLFDFYTATLPVTVQLKKYWAFQQNLEAVLLYWQWTLYTLEDPMVASIELMRQWGQVQLFRRGRNN